MLHLVELEELLKNATSNDVELRPDIDTFINRSVLGLKKCLGICEEYILDKKNMNSYELKNHSLQMADNSTKEIISATAIVHGGTIMSILSSLTNSDYFDFQVKNQEGYILEFDDDKLIGFNPIANV